MDIIVYNTVKRLGLEWRKTMKRNRNEIISEILRICIKGARKTKVVYQANLNFRTADPYLQLLIKNDLIVSSQGPHVVYKTTEKGMNLMKAIDQVHSTLAEYQDSLHTPTSA